MEQELQIGENIGEREGEVEREAGESGTGQKRGGTQECGYEVMRGSRRDGRGPSFSSHLPSSKLV